MQHKGKSLRPFIGAKDYEISRRFYRELGFDEAVLSAGMSYFQSDGLGFYLQNAYVKDWIDNTMVFMEVDNLQLFYKELTALQLPSKYEGVRVIPIRNLDWGSECFVHDPSGVLWHFGTFAKK